MEASGKGKSLSRDEVNFSFAAVLQLELRQKKCRTQDVMDQAIGSDEISEQIFMAAIRRVSILQIAVERIRPSTSNETRHVSYGSAPGVAKSVPKHSQSKAVAAQADGTHLTKGQLNAVNCRV